MDNEIYTMPESTMYMLKFFPCSIIPKTIKTLKSLVGKDLRGGEEKRLINTKNYSINHVQIYYYYYFLLNVFCF